MIQISNLVKKFGETVAVDINEYTIPSGEILGLVGNNGAGKTTLFRLLLDLLKPDSGSVLLSPSDETAAVNPAEGESWKMFTSTYMDEGFLIDFLTPEEYFGFIARINGIDDETLHERLERFTPFMGDEIMGKGKYIRNYSAGNKQKVGIVSALLNMPQILILDEPFNFLDPSSQNLLKKMLVDYNKETGATILVSSHNIQHTTEISTRFSVMEHGKIIMDLPNNGESAVAKLEDYFKV